MLFPPVSPIRLHSSSSTMEAPTVRALFSTTSTGEHRLASRWYITSETLAMELLYALGPSELRNWALFGSCLWIVTSQTPQRTFRDFVDSNDRVLSII